MSHSDPFAVVAALGVLPVIAIDRAEHAIPLADALLEGGLPAAEITFRTPAAADVIAALRAERPQLLVGAGTVLDLPSLQAAASAGAQFGLAPGFDPEVVNAALDGGLPFAPGAMTPSELSQAARRNLRTVKFFPAGAAGGPTMLEAISGPFAHLGIRFVPTGGVRQETMADWLRLRTVAAVGGTWIAPQADIAAGRWAEITVRAKEAVAEVARVRS